MARQQESTLYEKLVNSQFLFMKKGTHTIDEIYCAVKLHYTNLCDDSYYCSENCKEGNAQPEWKHVVRNALQRLKKNNGPIRYTGRRGYWDFGYD